MNSSILHGSRTLALSLTSITERPFLIDESDEGDGAFARARALGYTVVSSKTCKGIYRSLMKAIRIRTEGVPALFLSGEDLTCQAGLAVQQDLALVSLFGLSHVERNGHHYVAGMQARRRPRRRVLPLPIPISTNRRGTGRCCRSATAESPSLRSAPSATRAALYPISDR
ncbi:hypothetical protein GGI59_004235 [Rhizobium lentis]|uniref:Uncharacterized protein n=1 Tax=Rhizobium lentis TaxID=1138194 RepID=A0A7W9CWU4_9HYPH|nr:hypothetical protein [Rhizobium lentis]MBB5552008.1 hypothetical protein [Rhizobium lentis]MBB5562546.1 hypothetical protein [Rhizobium lentis]MBB5569907.1 hypothetical protein [Rhizobium lentis]